MPRKKSLKLNNTGCIFCSEVDDYPLLGPIIEKNGFKVHTNCIVSSNLWNTLLLKFAASGLSQTNNENESPDDFIVGFAVSSILNELRRGRSLKCSVCRLPGACVGCVVNTCHTTFHLPCLIKAQGITIFEGNFPSYCRRHANRQVCLRLNILYSFFELYQDQNNLIGHSYLCFLFIGRPNYYFMFRI